MNSIKTDISGFVYKNSIFYGIFFPTAHEDTVIDIVRTTEYASLYDDGKTTKVGRHEIAASSNADDGDPAWCFIMIDDMTFDGEENDVLADACIEVNVPEMLNREKKCAQAVKAMEDLYQVIISALKKKKVSLDDFYFGWKAMCCTWEITSSSSEEVTPVKTPTKGTSSPLTRTQSGPTATKSIKKISPNKITPKLSGSKVIVTEKK